MVRCRGVSLSSRPLRVSTEKEPEEPERTKNKERARKVHPVLFGRYPVYAVLSRRYPASGVPFGRYPVLAVPFGRYRELVVLRVVTFLAEAVKPKYGGIVSAVMQHGGNVLAVGGITKTW